MEQTFPVIARWVRGYGSIEIGDLELFGFVVRALGYGGLVFEDDKADTLAEPMATLEKGLADYFEQQEIEYRMNPNNLFANLPGRLPDELVTTLLDAADVRIERIFSHGHASPEGFWYDQDRHEWIVVLKGAARLRFEDGTVEMKPGDFVNIPAHKKHRVEWTTPDEPTIWLTVCYSA